MKRFWRDVSIADGAILLDGRPVRTPGRLPLVIPHPALAAAVAAEWRAVGETIDPRAMQMTGLANAAVERIAPARADFAATLAVYAQTDLLCYRADDPPELVARQAVLWDPPLDWARSRYDVHFTVTTGIIHRPQPAATVARLRDAVEALDAWRLAPLSPIVTLTGSLILALALIDRVMQADAVWQAAEVDATFQADHWGLDDLAEQADAARRITFDAAAAFLDLL